MKEWPLLLVFTAAPSSTAFAPNDEEHKADDIDKPAKEQEYTSHFLPYASTCPFFSASSNFLSKCWLKFALHRVSISIPVRFFIVILPE